MVRQISARDAQLRYSELTAQVQETAEPVLIQEDGRPAVALVSQEDFDTLERLRRQKLADEFTQRLAAAARESGEDDMTEEEIVEAVKATREELFRERYGNL